jgi:Amidohydrolase
MHLHEVIQQEKKLAPTKPQRDETNERRLVTESVRNSETTILNTFRSKWLMCLVMLKRTFFSIRVLLAILFQSTASVTDATQRSLKMAPPRTPSHHLRGSLTTYSSLVDHNRGRLRYCRRCSPLLLITFVSCCRRWVSTTTATAMSVPRVIDSHLHVWADANEAQTAFPYRGPSPPVDHLQNVASTTALLAQMDAQGVAGALIVQPLHHGFDHSYVRAALRHYPDRFKGMILYEPGTDVDRLEELLRSGHPSFRGVRFNPYLWKQQYLDGGIATTTTTMCDAAAEAVYKRCGEL